MWIFVKIGVGNFYSWEITCYHCFPRDKTVCRASSELIKLFIRYWDIKLKPKHKSIEDHIESKCSDYKNKAQLSETIMIVTTDFHKIGRK